MPAAFVDHFFPPTFFLPFTFLALLAFEKCSAPCNASVLAPPFLPMALAAWLSGEGFLGFMATCSELYHKILHTFADVLFFDFTGLPPILLLNHHNRRLSNVSPTTPQGIFLVAF